MYCKVPWGHTRIDANGEYRLCCVSGKSGYDTNTSFDDWWNSDYLHEIRQQITLGKIPDACVRCQKDENAGKTSLRQILNPRLPEPDLTYPVSVDISVDNTCNLACPSCSPNFSSQLAKEQNNWPTEFQRSVSKQNKDQQIQDLLTNRVQHLKITGGEPLLNRTFLRHLEQMPVGGILELVTNGTVFNPRVFEQLQKFDQILIEVSVDAVQDRFQYLRYPGSWLQVQSNILKMATLSNIHVSLNTVVSALSIETLHEVIEFSNANSLTVNFLTCAEPSYLTLAAVPDNLRQQVADQIDQAADKILVQADHPNLVRLKERFLTDAKSTAISCRQAEFNSELNQKLTRYLAALTQTRKLDYLAEFKSLLLRSSA